MLSWQRGQSKRRHPSVFPPPSHPSIDYLWAGLVESDWAECCECLPCLLSLIIHTHRGRAMTLTHTDTRTFLSTPPLVHTHRDMRSDFAYIIHAVETDHACIHAGVCSFASHNTVCVLHDTHARWQAAQPSSPPPEQTHTFTNTEDTRPERICRKVSFWRTELFNRCQKRRGEDRQKNNRKEHVYFMLIGKVVIPSTLRCFFSFICRYSADMKTEFLWVKKQKKTEVRSGARTFPYASDGSNPSPVQHRSGGNEWEWREYRRWRRWRRERWRRKRRGGGQRCCGSVQKQQQEWELQWKFEWEWTLCWKPKRRGRLVFSFLCS